MNKLICEFGKRTLVLGDKKYEIDHEVPIEIIGE